MRGWAEQTWHPLFSASATATGGGNQLYLKQRKTPIRKIIGKNFLAAAEQCMGTATPGSGRNREGFGEQPGRRCCPCTGRGHCHLVGHPCSSPKGSPLSLPHFITFLGSLHPLSATAPSSGLSPSPSHTEHPLSLEKIPHFLKGWEKGRDFTRH